MTEPEPFTPHEGGNRRSFHWASLRAWLFQRGWWPGSGRSLPDVELAYAFLAQRLVHDLPQRNRDEDGGHLVVLARLCDETMATDAAMLLADALAAESGREIVLVDADFQEAGLSRRFGCEDGRGLCELLSGDPPALAELLVQTAVDRVKIIPRGDVSALPAAIAPDQLAGAVAALRRAGSHVLLLQSRLADDSRNTPLAVAADLVTIIVEEAATLLPEIERAEAMLAASGVRDPKLLLARHRVTPDPTWPPSA